MCEGLALLPAPQTKTKTKAKQKPLAWFPCHQDYSIFQDKALPATMLTVHLLSHSH
jgi:hypothetical protein